MGNGSTYWYSGSTKIICQQKSPAVIKPNQYLFDSPQLYLGRPVRSSKSVKTSPRLLFAIPQDLRKM
jgi:hypothetical protein